REAPERPALRFRGKPLELQLFRSVHWTSFGLMVTGRQKIGAFAKSFKSRLKNFAARMPGDACRNNPSPGAGSAQSLSLNGNCIVHGLPLHTPGLYFAIMSTDATYSDIVRSFTPVTPPRLSTCVALPSGPTVVT